MKRTERLALAILLALLLASATPLFPGFPDVEVVTTIPAETTIADAGTRPAAKVWPEMIGNARRTLDIAEFYLSGEKGEALEPVIEAVLAAGRRGVKVRILSDAGMAGTYPDTLARFRWQPGIETRLSDWKSLTGGILHAKYFVVDGREAYVGSQNFDWRSLSHIHETGLRIRVSVFARALRRIFDADWNFSGGDRAAFRKLAPQPPLRFSPTAFLVASPAGFCPPGIGNALEAQIGLLDHARRRVTVQLLSYSVEGDPGAGTGKFVLIDRALRRAAGRGVKVSLLVSDWNLRPPALAALKDLARLPNMDVRFAVIPPSRRGFIPYARVIHSKVMRVDDDICWVGTSNWGYDYFFRSRNVEVVLKRPDVAKVLDALFLSLWNGPYAHKLDPDREYLPPRIN